MNLIIGFTIIVALILIYHYRVHQKMDDIDHQVNKWFKEEARKRDFTKK